MKTFFKFLYITLFIFAWLPLIILGFFGGYLIYGVGIGFALHNKVIDTFISVSGSLAKKVKKEKKKCQYS